ncbi:reverse transcriptase domain-containing protein [Tanacetum coccineum]
MKTPRLKSERKQVLCRSFTGEVVHNTDEMHHLRKQIEDMLKAGKLSHIIRELKQISGKEQSKKKGETSGKEKPQAILMIQSRQKAVRQKITQSFSPDLEISFYRSLRRSLDIFAWTPTDMTGVPRQIAEHRLNVGKGCQPVRQKKRGQAAERNVAINDEVSKLVTAGIMREVHYHDWLSNPVMVKKSDNSWRMCVDFKDLNKACPKDGYPLPEIDWKVESLCGFPFKCFLDAYKGYHQIQMAEEDEEKTVFNTNQGIFCYTKMPFGLRNAGATYQRLVDKTFYEKIGRNLEVYVDDLVIKSCTEDEVVCDIEETFKTLRKINLKLNLKKCTFGVEEGMFLGYQVNTKGIKILPDKVDAVLSIQSPKCLKDVQRLNGKLASLNMFLAKSAEKSLPFFKTLKKCTKNSDFLWTKEAEAAFRQMKEHIAKLPMLIAPEEQEELIVYLAASNEASGAKGPGSKLHRHEKLVLALVHASKRLRRYFQAQPIIVITDQPIKNILSNPEVAGRMQKWSIQLGEFGIHYRPRVSVKGKVLADFIIERPEEEGQDDFPKEEEPLPARRTLFTDGSSCVDGCRAGVILTDPKGVEFAYALRFQFEATNNEAEYKALIAGLRIAEKIGVQNLEVNVDSKLVANQVNGTYIAKETDMIKYLKKLCTSQQTGVGGGIERKIRERKRGARRGPWLRCVGPSQTNYVLREIHEGSCSMHVGTRSVVAKALRTGYYWPTMHKDARALIKTCQECQVHKPVPRNPQEKLNPITSPWPFYKWGIDIAGPFPEGPGKVKFLIVAMDYFTKWIEAKPVATITGNQVKKFVWENIVCRFGLPGEIISDNGKQFRDNPFRDWCEKLCIQQHFASVKHPQTNGLVERANRSLGEGIKARLGKDNKNWLEEISHVLWAHRTMIKSSNGDTPFSLTYGTEAVIPAEIGMPTFRTAEVDVAENDEALEINLELLEE